MHIAVDWDGTVVDPKTQEWLPGRVGDLAPLVALRRLLRDGHRVTLLTCRANWPEGLASIEAKLHEAGLGAVTVWTREGKPHAHVYVDNQSFPPFRGEWSALLAHVEKTTPVPRPRVARASVTALAAHPGWARFPKMGR